MRCSILCKLETKTHRDGGRTVIVQSYDSLGVGCFVSPADGAFACCLMRRPVARRVGSLRVSFCFGLHKKWLEQAAWMRRVEGGASGHVLAHVACTGAKRARWTIRKMRPRFHTSPSRMFASKTCTAGYLRGMPPILLLVHSAQLSGGTCRWGQIRWGLIQLLEAPSM